MVFMDTVWRHTNPIGIAALLHPESHFTDPKAAALRSNTYRRLARHWQFNELSRWFDADSPTACLNVYGRARHSVEVVQISNITSISFSTHCTPGMGRYQV